MTGETGVSLRVMPRNVRVLRPACVAESCQVKRTEGGVKQEMEAFKDTLKPEQVDALVKFTRTLGPK